ncbi:hypothetical protein EZV62_027262 [Acer yangbiense]|uniref:Uncharacterized protein n=1 Tax=Acer yangbiense TaxID=1000413 RepID=A0A5C7GTB5_9ROSI|nr:hypothetical protein EZV62_027262 [Acer yangbiense]
MDVINVGFLTIMVRRTRYDHPLLVEGRYKSEWVLPITVHAPPPGTQAAHARKEKSFSLEPLWAPLVVTADSSPDPVLDIAGEKLHTGTDYYILPVVRGRGGGLTLASTGNETCPLDVVQERQESTVWKLDSHDDSLGQWFVTTGGVEGNPGRETISNWFKIEKFDDDYKLVFCPSVCDTCRVLCRDIGIYIDQATGIRRLALSDTPFKVMFKKA